MMKNRTVVVIEDSSKCDFGGGQKITMMVSEILANKYDIHFVDFTSTSRFVKMTRSNFPNSKFTTLYIKKYSFKNKRISWLIESIISFMSLPFHLNAILKKIEIEKSCVYATTKKGLIIAYFLNVFKNTPYVFHAHLVEDTSSVFYAFYTLLLKKADATICVSKTVFNTTQSINRVLIYNPHVNPKGFKGLKTDKKFIIAAIGVLTEIKGFDYYIKAALQVDANVEFRLYGEGLQKEYLMTIADGRIRFMGFNLNILSELYNDIDIVIVPTIIQEALSLVIVEAKSVGIPVITTNIGAQSEIVQDGIDGYKVPVKDAASIAQRVMQLTTNIELYNKMAIESFNSSFFYSYNTFKKSIDDIFQY